MLTSNWDALIAAKQNETATATFSIPILSDTGATIGSLVCIDYHLCRDDTIIADLTVWRNHAMHCFLTQFTATPERTRTWLMRLIIPTKNRVLFLICDTNNQYIGNIGICNITEESIEIDNVLRGKKHHNKDIMYYSIITLLNISFKLAKISSVYLHVFSNNARAINLYKKCGFKKISSSKLIKTPTPDGVAFLISDRSNIDFEYEKMGIERNNFL